MTELPTYYSLRQWSPYQGTVQIVEIRGFRAVSRDGQRWQVQVRNEGIRFFTYGTWSADGSGNLIATDRTQAIVSALEGHPPLPFPAIDNLELWLLDQEQLLPLALLRSMPDTRRPFVSEDPRWQSALSINSSFVSPSILRRAEDSAAQHIPHQELLERFVSAAAGAFPSAQWFRRDAKGNGQGLGIRNVADAIANRSLESEAFPPLLVREHWDDEMFEQLVDDYHSWQAPELLTHASLSSSVRDLLEHKASGSAERIYNLRNVLPKIINRELIDRVFVEAVIRKSVPA